MHIICCTDAANADDDSGVHISIHFRCSSVDTCSVTPGNGSPFFSLLPSLTFDPRSLFPRRRSSPSPLPPAIPPPNYSAPPPHSSPAPFYVLPSCFLCFFLLPLPLRFYTSHFMHLFFSSCPCLFLLSFFSSSSSSLILFLLIFFPFP